MSQVDFFVKIWKVSELHHPLLSSAALLLFWRYLFVLLRHTAAQFLEKKTTIKIKSTINFEIIAKDIAFKVRDTKINQNVLSNKMYLTEAEHGIMI